MEFVFVSGNLALDLLGTLKWRRAEPEEGLVTPADVGRWAVAAGVVTVPPPVGPADLARLRELREAIYRLVGDRGTGADLRVLNAAAAAPRTVAQLTPHGAERRGAAEAVAAEVAHAAIDLLDGLRAARLRIRECERPACTRIFVDRSRGGTRAWCGMAECGNRAKAASYRARKAAARVAD